MMSMLQQAIADSQFATERTRVDLVDCSEFNDTTTWKVIVQTVLMALISLIGILGNVVMLLCIVHFPSSRLTMYPVTILFLNLTIADLISAGIYQPILTASLIVKKWSLSTDMSIFFVYMNTTATIVSNYTVAFIACYHFLYLANDTKVGKHFTRKKITSQCVLCWIISLMFVVLPSFLNWDVGKVIGQTVLEDEDSIPLWHIIVAGTLTYTIPFAIQTVCYIGVYFKVREVKEYFNKINKQRILAVKENQIALLPSWQIRIPPLVTILSAFVVVFFLCNIVHTLCQLVTTNPCSAATFNRVGLFLSSLRSSVNPFLYGWRNQAFRDRVLSILRCKTSAHTRFPLLHFNHVQEPGSNRGEVDNSRLAWFEWSVSNVSDFDISKAPLSSVNSLDPTLWGFLRRWRSRKVGMNKCLPQDAILNL